MVRSCSAYNCSNRNLPGGKLAFHQFPLQDNVRLKKWLKNMRREHFYPSRTTYLCSEHFEDKCYWKGHKKKLLNDNAVPTIFNFSEHHFKKIPVKSKVKKLLKKSTADKSGALETPSIKKIKNKQGRAVDRSKNSFLKKRTDSNSDKRKYKRTIKVLKTDIDSDDQMFEQCLINEDNGDIFILNDMNETVESISSLSESQKSTQLVKNNCEPNFQSVIKNCNKNVQSMKNECVENCGLVSKNCGHKNNNNYCKIIEPSVINKYAKGDHTYVKNTSDQMEEVNTFLQASNGAKISPESIFEAMGDSGIPDANVLEAIHEMGKSNAVIILVKEELLNPSQVIRKKRTKCNILQNVDLDDPGGTGEIGEIDANIPKINDEIIKHNKSNSSVYKMTSKGDETNGDVFKVEEEFKNIDARILESDKSVFRPKRRKEKSSAGIINTMQTDHLKLTNEMLHVVNLQRKEIDNLKMLLSSERTKTKMLCNIEDIEVKPKARGIHEFGVLLHSISPVAYDFVKHHTNLDLPDATLIELYSKLVKTAHLKTE